MPDDRLVRYPRSSVAVASGEFDRRVAAGEPIGALARAYGVSTGTVHNYAPGRRYAGRASKV